MTDNLCLHCNEPVEGGVLIPHVSSEGAAEMRHWHRECRQRAIIGGLNHLLGTCTCCGGTEPPDPPWLSRREAARVAVAQYQARHAGPSGS